MSDGMLGNFFGSLVCASIASTIVLSEYQILSDVCFSWCLGVLCMESLLFTFTHDLWKLLEVN
jgi:hypothetical protein